MKPIRHVSFVDCPGHDILMATMLNGAAVMDAAVLLIAANETCPQPQTSEHLAAMEIMKLEHLIILQNKVDLIKEAQALRQRHHSGGGMGMMGGVGRSRSRMNQGPGLRTSLTADSMGSNRMRGEDVLAVCPYFGGLLHCRALFHCHCLLLIEYYSELCLSGCVCRWRLHLQYIVSHRSTNAKKRRMPTVRELPFLSPRQVSL